MIRLQKFLADCGVCSRRKAETLIANGEVKVNNKTILEMGFKIDPIKDVVLLNNKKITKNNKKVYILFNKPEFCVTTSKDQFDRKTVLDYINISQRVVPVGRLDYETSGLLLLTNDGDLTYQLTHPKHNIKKFYVATIEGIPSRESLDRLKSGVIIDDSYKTKGATIKFLKRTSKTATIEIAISEGKNRQVRKMFDAIGHDVLELKRVAIENLKIGELKKGKYRYLTQSEITYLKNLVKA